LKGAEVGLDVADGVDDEAGDLVEPVAVPRGQQRSAIADNVEMQRS
jgi:hypothetical protein